MASTATQMTMGNCNLSIDTHKMIMIEHHLSTWAIFSGIANTDHSGRPVESWKSVVWVQCYIRVVLHNINICTYAKHIIIDHELATALHS